MSEKTQLYFVWFAGCFLKSLFDDMFESVRVQDENIRRVRDKHTLYIDTNQVPHTKKLDSSCNPWQALHLRSCHKECVGSPLDLVYMHTLSSPSAGICL